MAEGVRAGTHTAPPNEPESIIPGVVPQQDEHPQMEQAPALVCQRQRPQRFEGARTAPPNDPVSIVRGVVSHDALDEHPQMEATPELGCQRQCAKWLEERVRQDRLALCQHMEAQHEKLLFDFQTMCARVCSKASSVTPQPWRQVSFSWRPADLPASLMQHALTVVQPPAEPPSIPVPDTYGLDTTHYGEGTATDDSNERLDIEKQVTRSPINTRSTTMQLVDDASQFLDKVEVFVEGQMFEMAIIAVIFLNAASIAVEQQYNGEKLGCRLSFPSYEESGKWWSGAPTMFAVLDKVFVAIFLVELALRLTATRQRWFKSLWNYIDCLLVCIAVASWLQPIFGVMNPTFVRMVRFGKLARIMRVMRSNRLVDSLKLLTASIQASYNTLCLSLFVLLLIHTGCAMLLSQLVEPFLKSETDPSDLHQQDVKNQVFAYYGTFWRSMITMFEITFANWAPTCRLLVDNVSESFGLFFLVHRCVVGFAVLSVIQAVFIQQTMKSAKLDEDFIVQQKQRERDSYAAKLRNVFKQLDTSGDGQLSWDEFYSLVSDSHMKLLMNALDIDINDMESLFQLLDDGDGRIDSDEFVDGLQRIKGPAQSLDIVNLLQIVGRIEAKLAKIKSIKSKSFLQS